MNKKEKLETLYKLRNQVKQIVKQKEVKQVEKDNSKKLVLTKKDGFANMSLVVELMLGISLAVGTMSIINVIIEQIIK